MDTNSTNPALPTDGKAVITPNQKKRKRNKLDLSPSHIKTELYRWIDLGYGSQVCHKMLLETFKNDPSLIKASRRTIQAFINSYLEGKTQSPQSVISVGTSPTPTDTSPNMKQVLLDEFRALDQIIKSNPSSKPDQFNADLFRVLRERREVLELMLKFQGSMQSQDIENQNETFKKDYAYFMMIGVEHAFEEMCGKEKIHVFKDVVLKHLETQTENFQKFHAAAGGN